VLATEGPEAAKAAGLRYTTDAVPGIRRVKRRGHFAYLAPDGTALTDARELARIKTLAIPPAYRDVWICPLANGHLQATGRDARGRKQYRYHARWRAVRDETKFHRTVAFAKALPAIRAAVARDLGLRGMPREKVLAAVVALLETTALRVGNEEYARENDSYGLTTLHEEHADVRGATIRFRFRGKSGKTHEVAIHDRRLARIVKASQDLPGQHLFEYLDERGVPHPVRSEDVNDYLRAIAGGDFTAKDFRTWQATVRCALLLAPAQADGMAAAKAAVVDAVARVAAFLGNTPAVCRRAYVHPGLIAEFLAHGALALRKRAPRRSDPFALSPHEAAVVDFIERLAAREARTAA